MSELVDKQIYTKTLLNNKKSVYELPTKNSHTNAETPSVRKRKVGVLSAEKQPISIRQGYPGQSLEREEAPLGCSFNRTVSPLFVSAINSAFQESL